MRALLNMKQQIIAAVLFGGDGYSQLPIDPSAH